MQNALATVPRKCLSKDLVLGVNKEGEEMAKLRAGTLLAEGTAQVKALS